MRYVDYIYDIVRLDCLEMDAIYADYIKQMVGVYGINALIEHNLIESCGVINGRQLYVLRENKGKPVEELDELEQLKRDNKKLKDWIMKGFQIDS